MPAEGTLRSHQVPLAALADEPRAPRRSSRSGCAPTGPRSSSTRTARSCPSSPALAPRGDRRMSANPHANGGALLRDARPAGLPRLRRRRAVARDASTPRPPACSASCLRDVHRGPTRRRNFRIFGPDETASNRLGAVFEVTDRAWEAETASRPTTTCRRDGRVMEVLSEHLCQGWLEGYLLTGRHGLFNCYEAFIHIVDSMFNQHAKWLKVTREIPWRRPIAVAQLPAHLARLAPGPQRLLAPGPRLHRPRGQQEGGDRPRLPAARRQLPAVGGRPLPAQPRLRQRDRGRQAAGAALARRWRRRSSTARAASASGSGPAATRGAKPDVVLACAGDVPTLEALAAVDVLLREHLPDLRIRVVNVVDLMRLQPRRRAPARPRRSPTFDALFTTTGR